uniref:Limbic system associated membrane protein n=1 Tax=Leptobrachium leishanense TaxID=445787 RepID=A0A8C5N0Z5_9ANUR
ACDIQIRKLFFVTKIVRNAAGSEGSQCEHVNEPDKHRSNKVLLYSCASPIRAPRELAASLSQSDTSEIIASRGRCFVEDKSYKVAWLNRSGIIFAGQDKWSLDPRVELDKRSVLEYSLRIQKVDVFDEGPYTCSVQTQHHTKTTQIYLIVQVPPKISNISSDVTVNEGSNVTLVCMANGRPDPIITWRHLTPTGRNVLIEMTQSVTSSRLMEKALCLYHWNHYVMGVNGRLGSRVGWYYLQ